MSKGRAGRKKDKGEVTNEGSTENLRQLAGCAAEKEDTASVVGHRDDHHYSSDVRMPGLGRSS